MRRRLVVLLAALVIAGCTQASGVPSPVSAPASAPSSVVPAGNLPPGCEPIELRTPDGALVELDGTWIEQSRTSVDQLTWWIRTRGDCLWAVGTVADVPEQGFDIHLGTVLNYRGTIRPDFSIDGQLVHLGPQPSNRPEVPIVSDSRFLIVFTDDGGIELREDREGGVVDGGPRCVEQSFCYPPLVLVPRDG
jgi:hypothetical protein